MFSVTVQDQTELLWESCSIHEDR